MNLKENAINGNRMLSRDTEYLLKILKAFQNIVAIFKINSIGFSLFFFLLLYVGLLGFMNNNWNKNLIYLKWIKKKFTIFNNLSFHSYIFRVLQNLYGFSQRNAGSYYQVANH